MNPPTKTARLVKSCCSSGCRSVVAPLDRAAERPLALGETGARRRPQKIEPRAETLEQRARREQIAARRGELERQRQTVEPDAELAHRLGVRLGELEVGPGRPGAIDEQPDRLDLAAARASEGRRDRSGSSSAGTG